MAKGKYAKWLEPENLILLEGWARDGLTDEDIANKMGITRSTFYAWKDKYSVISDALKNGKEVADFAVENALYKSALGYDVVEYEEKIDAMGVKQRCEKKRHIPPNTTAQIFWLKNRKPSVWREKQEAKVEVYESDGFLDAIKADAAETFAGGDDSAMVVTDE